MSPAVAPEGLWSAWSFEPGLLAASVAAAVVYARRRTGAGRARRMAFFAGVAVVVFAVSSPLQAFGEALFAAHMGQHLVLMLGAAPAIAYGLTGTQSMVRRGTFTRLGDPIVLVAVSVVILWAWHLPALYTAALEQAPLHAVEHVSLLLGSVAFWVLIVPGGWRALGHAARAACLFVSMVASGALGALLTLSPSLLYPIHDGRTAAWGLTALEDQQLAGALMWVPPGLGYLMLIAVLLARALNSVAAEEGR